MTTPDPKSSPDSTAAPLVAPYSHLAAGYDVIMEHVDYVDWADYILDMLDEHPGPGGEPPATLLELGCGTGSFALEFTSAWEGDYAGVDASPEMIAIARAKADAYGAPLTFEVADFTAFTLDRPVDAALLLYDGLNYLHETADIERLFQRVYDALVPGGVFLFDQSTPANSINNAAYFEDEGEAEGFRYVRHSHYDEATRLHTTTFAFEVEGVPVREAHVERAYELGEIRALLEASPFEIEAAYHTFSLRPATERSERIHWAVRRPERS